MLAVVTPLLAAFTLAAPEATRRASSPTMFIGPAIGTVAAAVAASSVKIVGTGEVLLLERLGKYSRRLEPGLHFTVPLIDRVSFSSTLRERVFDIKSHHEGQCAAHGVRTQSATLSSANVARRPRSVHVLPS